MAKNDSTVPEGPKATPPRTRSPYAPQFCSVCGAHLRTVAYVVLSARCFPAGPDGVVDWGEFRAVNTHDDVRACSWECWQEVKYMPLAEIFVRSA